MIKSACDQKCVVEDTCINCGLFSTESLVFSQKASICEFIPDVRPENMIDQHHKSNLTCRYSSMYKNYYKHIIKVTFCSFLNENLNKARP